MNTILSNSLYKKYILDEISNLYEAWNFYYHIVDSLWKELKGVLDDLWQNIVIHFVQKSNEIYYLYASLIKIIDSMVNTKNLKTTIYSLKLEKSFNQLLEILEQFEYEINSFHKIEVKWDKIRVREVLETWNKLINILNKIKDLVDITKMNYDLLTNLFFKNLFRTFFVKVKVDWNEEKYLAEVITYNTEELVKLFKKYKQNSKVDFITRIQTLKNIDEKRKIFIEILRRIDIEKLEELKNIDDKQVKFLLNFLMLSLTFSEFMSILLKLAQLLDETIYKKTNEIIKTNIVQKIENELEVIFKKINEIIKKWVEVHKILYKNKIALNNEDIIKRIYERKEEIEKEVRELIGTTKREIMNSSKDKM